MAWVNYKMKNGRAAAVCQCCNRQSRYIQIDDSGEPDFWRLPHGWSSAPFPKCHVHNDGSIGSSYTCPECNKRLRAGESLPLRSGQLVRLVA
jgi:hypothetical protein